MLARNRLRATLWGTAAAAAAAASAIGGGAAVAAGAQGQLLLPPSGVTRSEDLGRRAHSNIEIVVPKGGLAGTGAASPVVDWLVETPASLACAYHLVTVVPGCNPYTVSANPIGGSRAIAIVEPFNYADARGVPAAASDLAVFDKVFGLPAANFTVIFGTGSPSAGCKNGSAPQQSSAQTGFDVEAAADIEWAHAMAPSAKLYLVEANSNSLTDLLNAVGVATSCVRASGGGEVSIGWGTGEFSGENANDGSFTGLDVTYFAAVGDLINPPPPESGFPNLPVLYPAASPNVIGVGGTTFSRNQIYGNGAYQSQATWNVNYSLIGILYGASGGPSTFEPRPTFQSGVAKIVGTTRGTPDLAALADPDTGVWEYNSTFVPGKGVFMQLGGTAVATAITAGIFNELGLFYPSSQAALAALYANTGLVRTKFVTAVTSGLCGPPGALTLPSGYLGGFGSPYDPSYILATTGLSWNWCTGWGSMHGSK